MFRSLLLSLVWATLLLLAPQAQAYPVQVTSVPQVDLSRYLGKWYEIAALPMFFQRNCVGDTTAEYSLNGDGSVAVHNRCRTKDGVDEAKGRATVLPNTGNARLEVSFFWPFKGDYWVIGLDPDYRWALVGQPSRKYLWLLSRTPQLPQADIDKALGIAVTQGYLLRELKFTPQTPLPVIPPPEAAAESSTAVPEAK